MKYLFFIFLILPLSLYAQGQVKAAPLAGRARIDSMLQRIPNAKEDTNKARLLISISFQFRNYDPNAGIRYGKEALTLAEKLKWRKGVAKAYNSLGTNYEEQANNDTALDCFLKALKINEETDSKQNTAQNLGNIAILYYNQGNYPKALEYYFRALKIFEELNDKEDVAATAGNIGSLFYSQGNYKKAVEYDSLALKICHEMGDRDGEAVQLSLLGSVYFDLGSKDIALKTDEESLKIYEELGNKAGIGRDLTNIGVIYGARLDYYKDLECQYKALKIYEALGSEHYLGIAYANIGSIYLDIVNDTNRHKADNPPAGDAGLVPASKKGCLALSISYLQKGIALAKKTNNLNSLAIDLLVLSNAQKADNKYKEALESYRQYVLFKDSVFNSENNLKINNLEHEQEIGVKESQIKILAEENKLKDLRDDRERLTNRILIGSTAMVLIVAFSLVSYYVRKQKHEKFIANERINALLKDQELKSVSNMLEIQELERKRIAADLHDRVGSMLSTVKLYFNLVEEQLDKLKEQNKEQYHKATTLLDDACNEVRKISHELVSGELLKFGLVSAINQMKETIGSTGKLKMTVLAFGMEWRLDSAVESSLYRIVQELMNNVLKHSKATEVTIQLNRVQNDLNIVVEDNGVGFDVPAAMTEDGMGLKNIETRVKKLNGTISIDSGKGKGTTTIIDIPV